jgi:hypothetical protein
VRPDTSSTTSASQTAGSHLLAEGLINLTEAAKELRNARGRGPHVASIRRWAKTGVRGYRLETTFVGGRLPQVASLWPPEMLPGVSGPLGLADL